MNFYNENDPRAAAWLRELISANLIPPGHVEEKSIVELEPDGILGYDQCHFFAGVGGWSLALQLAGWPADRPVWTGSCPCQPFSVAGKGKGTSDKRHLWPEFRRLIAECQPPTVFGEQVAGAAGREWLSGVRDDMEALGYAVGAADLCAASVSAPHIRQRLYWVANSKCNGGRADESRRGSERRTAGRGIGGLGDAASIDQSWAGERGKMLRRQGETRRSSAWSDYDIAPCRDGKSRRIESGLQPLVARLPRGLVPSGDPGIEEARSSAEARVMRLRGYGNSLCVPVAAEFIMAFLETTARIPPRPHAPAP